MSAKPTSLKKVLTALDTHGHTYEVADSQVRVPDEDHPGFGGGAFRRHRVPKKQVPGTVVVVKGHWGFYETVEQQVRLYFTETGSYVADMTTGGYPFRKGWSLTNVLETLARYAPSAVAERKAQREQEAQEKDEREAREVAEAYAAATQAVTEAQATLFENLTALVGLTEAQARSVVAMAQTEGNSFTALTAALAAKERVGRGWLPGKTSVYGIYENGVRVG